MALAVVPPGEADLVGMKGAVRVHQVAFGEQLLEPSTLMRRDVGRADECRRVVDVDVGGAHVEVAGDDRRT
jgi:hypothetical protein